MSAGPPAPPAPPPTLGALSAVGGFSLEQAEETGQWAVLWPQGLMTHPPPPTSATLFWASLSPCGQHLGPEPEHSSSPLWPLAFGPGAFCPDSYLWMQRPQIHSQDPGSRSQASEQVPSLPRASVSPSVKRGGGISPNLEFKEDTGPGNLGH